MCDHMHPGSLWRSRPNPHTSHGWGWESDDLQEIAPIIGPLKNPPAYDIAPSCRTSLRAGEGCLVFCEILKPDAGKITWIDREGDRVLSLLFRGEIVWYPLRAFTLVFESESCPKCGLDFPSC